MRIRVYLAIVAILASSIYLSPQAEATTWTLIYQTTSTQRDANQYAIYTAGYERNGAAQTAAAGQNFSQVRWRMEMTISGTLYYVDAYFDKWSGATLADLQFPDYANILNLQKNVTNLVVTSNYSPVKTGSYALGRVEIWPYNYSQSTTGISPAGSASIFDFDDSAAIGTNGHGTFQLHNLTDTQTVLAWNRSRYGDTAELGFGPCKIGATPCTNTDWTLETGLSPSAFKFQVFIGTAAPSASSLSIAPGGSSIYRTSSTITATLGVAGSDGKVTFYQNGKRISGCINISSSNLAATCNWKPSTRGRVNLYATLAPTSAGYLASTSPIVLANVGTRIVKR
ncbi:hypothetical protein MCEJIRE27_01036 [Candidatus Nanopelagicaceae bacterium]